MNEMKMVRDLLAEPAPPSVRATGAALQALESEIAGRRPRRRVRARRRLVGRMQLGLTGLVAAGAAAAVAVATLGGGGTAVPQPEESGGTSARSILLAAAEQAAKEPTGRYWRVQTVDGQAYRVGDEGAGGYTVLGYTSQWDRWTARSDSDDNVLYARDLGARPLTAADKAAWKKAGSPKTMRVWSNDHWATLSTVPGKTYGVGPGGWQEDRTTSERKKRAAKDFEQVCAKMRKDGKPLSDADCRALREGPNDVSVVADPSKVGELLFPKRTKQIPAHAREVPAGLRTQERDAAGDLMSGFMFLTLRPATPEVRAAAFRLLAGVSGVRTIGSVTDDRGRTGIGLAARGTMQEGSGTVFDYQLILEPKTYRILSGRKVVVKPGGSMKGMRPGDVLNRDLVLQAGWTNETPHHA
ncbi:hypothetical protein [Actinomadura rugatobispora]|uniref:Uncharacterized protein n=1 Tax=Actinomadura rugatobispora TaxID=1994 RepID=A0ABW1AJG5_9ACTN|nr:hypothetical protein GCM10010200_046200 [Actinomadura rugatobispora]